jgi:hypothetical protein
MTKEHSHTNLEKKTVEAMIKIYCKSHHESNSNLCTACDELLNYAHSRLDKCPFHEDKPTCANCTVHCYMPVMRGKIKTVMRYSGPRMIVSHPYLAIKHVAKSKRKPPEKDD